MHEDRDVSATPVTWAIVLAGGAGERLAPLTRALHGKAVPKQFAALLGRTTFFEETLERIAQIARPDRTVVVVPEAHASLARAQAAAWPGVEIVAQPENRGTGPGLLLPLAHVRARDPSARVAIFPADHHIRRNAPFVEAVQRALAASAFAPSGVALVGAAAEAPSTDLGWIVPGEAPAAPDRGVPVVGFVEKPDLPTAWRLLEARALWNTLILAGTASALRRLMARHLPEQTCALLSYTRSLGTTASTARLRRLYADMKPADLSHRVLAVARGLVTVPMIDAGWSDCGTTERLIAALKGTPDLERLKDRLATGSSTWALPDTRRGAELALPPPA